MTLLLTVLALRYVFLAKRISYALIKDEGFKSPHLYAVLTARLNRLRKKLQTARAKARILLPNI